MSDGRAKAPGAAEAGLVGPAVSTTAGTASSEGATPDALDAPDGITVDGTGLLCVTLLLRLRKEIDGAAPGTLVHVVATDPAAPLDLPAWCHMTGHHYLGRLPDEDRPAYALRLAAGARRTRPDAPWHTDGDAPGGTIVG